MQIVEGVGDLGEPDVIVDALLGIGLTDAPREDAARMIELMNASGRPVVAVDVPSGVNASTGEIAGGGRRRDGHRHVRRAEGRARDRARPLPRRLGSRRADRAAAARARALARPCVGAARSAAQAAESTKYSAGSVLIVGGSRGLTGAPMLAALAAFRSDAGYVAVAAPESTLPVLETALLEVVKRPLPEDSCGSPVAACRSTRFSRLRTRPMRSRSGRASVEATGRSSSCGFCSSNSTCRSCSTPTRLWGLEPFAGQAPTVLTPHSGELASLLGVDAREIDAHRLDAVRRATARFGSVVLLKGADTLVAAPREGVLVATYGTPALATAGSGDVLTGIVAAFLAKGMEPRFAAAAAAVAHGVAAELVDPQAGAMASDLLPELRRALAGHGLQRAPLQ